MIYLPIVRQRFSYAKIYENLVIFLYAVTDYFDEVSRERRSARNYNPYRSTFSNSREREVNKRREEREKGRRNEEVRRPQESVAKVVAVEACTGLMGTR